MKTEIKITKADPAGNITLLIDGPVPKGKYAQLASALMKTPGLEAEQAGFITRPLHGGAGRLEMSGGEFCGNAARAFGYYLALKSGEKRTQIPVEISGAEEPVMTESDTENATAFSEMPLPREISVITLPEPFGKCCAVRFDGITHIIAIGVPEDMHLFIAARDYIYRSSTPAALGVLFVSEDKQSLVPYVYVAGTKTVFREGSCGSGTAALCAAEAYKSGKSTAIAVAQPAGEIEAEATVTDGKISRLKIGGSVKLYDAVSATADI